MRDRHTDLVLPGAKRHEPRASCARGLGLTRVVTLSLCCRQGKARQDKARQGKVGRVQPGEGRKQKAL